MDAADKRMLDREALRNMIQQWNANRLDLFELSEPNENLEFHGVMRFYFQDSGQKIATKCIRVASDATVSDVIETLIEKFRPDMRMLSLGSYSLWETHGPDDERRLEPHEKPLLVQLNWHADDREGRFLLKCLTNNEVPLSTVNEKADQNFKRKLSKREKKELKKKEKLSRLKSDTNDENRPVAEKLYTELPETSFTRSISNPEAVMRRRRQQKLERKLQQFRSKDGGPDTGGTLKIYGSSLCPDVPYKTLLLSVGDTAAGVVREMLDKYGLSRHDPHHYCIVQVDTADNSEYILEDDECPLAIVMTHHHRSSIMFHVRRRPTDAQPRRRKKKSGVGTGSARPGNEPMLVEVSPDGSTLENGRRVRITDLVEVGSGNGTALQLYGPSIQPRHCVVAPAEGGGFSVTPLHTDAHVYVNGRRAVHSQRLQHGCLLKFGRVSTFRFVDPAQENIINRNLSQSQHYGSGSIYDRSPPGEHRNSGAMSPTSLASQQPDALDANANAEDAARASPQSREYAPYNNNTLKLDNESLMMSQHLDDSKDDYIRDDYAEQDQSAPVSRVSNAHYKDNYETTFDLDGNVETKSICSAKSGGSGHDNRSGMGSVARAGQEAILPAVLEFPEAGQAHFLAAVITHLDPHAPAFKLAPVYTLYLCARYRASTHYRPELTPTERAHKLTAFLHHVATLIHATVQERCTDSAAQAFWMANASELLHFLKCDRHISSFSTQAQDLLPTTVQNAFSNLVSCFQEELSRALAELTSPAAADATEATAPTLQALAAAMVLLRRCRVNAALTIQLFSHLFHYINAVCFNKLVTEAGTVSARWGAALSARLALVAAWAERQGLELAADCHLARTHQAARLISGTYRSAEEVCGALGACFKLNSVQVRALLAPLLPPELVDAAVAHARSRADELYRADGREITLEESVWLGAALLIPGDGFSAEVVRGVPPGLAEFVAPLQRGGLCRLAHQPHARGLWTVYMHGYGAPAAAPADHPRVHIVQLHKNSNGMGLSIVAAKGAGQSKLGIYIKSVVPDGAAAADGRLAAGDQLLSVDGHSLVGITQEKAAEYLVRTGPTVTLEVAKQGAVLHGLATLLHQPAYNQRQDEEVQYEDPASRNSGTFTNPHPALLRPTSPLTELVTAGSGRFSYRNHCQILRDETSESSTDETEDFHPHYHGSIPRLIITLDRENNQLQEDLSPETPGFPLELKDARMPPPQIPIFTFTCEDVDAQDSCDTLSQDTHVPMDLPAPILDPPANYDQSSESGEAICLPPEMKPIDTKLTLDLFNFRTKEDDYRGRCTGVDECVSACECCRTPQPEAQQIPYIDEPNSEPLIFESDGTDKKVATPKIRRILPSLSLDMLDDKKPKTVDATCQTPSPPLQPKVKSRIRQNKKDFSLNLTRESNNIDKIQSRLRKTLFSVSKSLDTKSEDTEEPSISTTESIEELSNDIVHIRKVSSNPVDIGVMLDNVDRKSWKSPDEYRPAFGKVKALTKHFNQINLKYCVKSYKRNCQSSPNLSAGLKRETCKTNNLPTSASLANIQYEPDKTDTSKSDKMSEDEVKSILIQLEDWSKFGSRGSEDTLAQGNEFEIPNLPSEEHTDPNVSNTGSYVFTEIIEKKPKTITLENIILKPNHTSENLQRNKQSTALPLQCESLKNISECDSTKKAKMERKHVSSADLSRSICGLGTGDSEWVASVQSCPDVSSACDHDTSIRAYEPQRHQPPSCAGVTGGAARRASERDLPSRLAAEPVKPSKSTPALHHAPLASPLSPASPASHASASHLAHQMPPPSALSPQATHTPLQNSGTMSPGAAGGAWAHKSRSSHNLSAQSDSFYQNLSSVHAHHHPLQDRWSSLRSSTGSGRPQSAHFAASHADHTPEPAANPQHQVQANTANVRAAKLAEMSEEVTRRQQQHQQFQQQQQQHQFQQQQFQHQNQQQQQQQQFQQQQLHQQHYQQQQQLQQLQAQQKANPTHSQIAAQPSPSSMHVHASPQSNQTPMHVQTGQGSMHVHATAQPGQGPMHVHAGSQPGQNQMHVHTNAHYSPQLPQGMHLNMHSQYVHTSQTPTQAYHNQPAQSQRYDWHPPGPPSPQRSQPPVAPKPVSEAGRRSETDMDDQYMQHPHTQPTSTMQPDDERYLASASEPPAVSVYPVGGAAGERARPPAHNPWQREERERQAEARRAAARARRDAAIAQLVSLGGARTAVQNQQLRALQLERDFERRATMHQDEGGDREGGGEEEEESPSPEPEREREGERDARDLRQPPPPKSILKSAPRPELTNGYTTHTSTLSETTRITEVSASVSNLSLSGAAAGAVAGDGVTSPPPPPERGSSFAVMATRRALDPPHTTLTTHAAHATHVAHAPVATHHHEHTAAPPPLSPVSSGRDKRVSFHERAAAAPPAPPASSPPPLDPPAAAREDPDRFIEEAESMLAGPASPAGATPPAAHTPGVIGAQEVYRDPRARRLAEAQARAPAAPVPEQLSFKEKMKMFALESGEQSTPKDKVKISRAQRDIDAVH